MRSTNRSGRVQATGGENSVTSVPQQPDIIPLKEVEKHAILVAVKRLGVQGAAIALGVGKTTISSETTGMATRPPRVGIGMADCSNNKTEYITQRGSKGNRISQMVSGYDGTASRRAVGCSDSGASGRGEEQDGTKAPKPIKVWRMPRDLLPTLPFLTSSAALEARTGNVGSEREPSRSSL